MKPFSDEPQDQSAIPFDLKSYLELVDWSGRMVLPNKQGAISLTTPPILQRLKVDSHQFAAYLRTKPDKLPNALGPTAALLKLAQSFGLKFLHGMTDRKTLLIAD